MRSICLFLTTLHSIVFLAITHAADVDTTGTTVVINADEPANRYLGNGTLKISADVDSLIELAKSSTVGNTEFAMTGGTLTIDTGVRLRNGGWNKGVWTANLSKLEINGVLDLWDGQSVFGDALTGGGLIDIRSGTAWSGTKSLFIGNLGGSGAFSGTITAGDASRNIQIIKKGTGQQIFNNLANQRARTFHANNGVLEFSTSSNLTMATSIVSTDSGTLGNFTKSGSGSLTISDNFSPSGTTTVSGGALTIFNSPPASASIVLAVGTRFGLHFPEIAIVSSLRIAGSGSLPGGIYNASHPTYGSYFSGPGSLRVISETAAQSTGNRVLGALTTHGFNLSLNSDDIDYTINLNSQTYDVWLPSNYNPNETYGLILFCNSGNNGGDPPQAYRDVLNKYRIIWVAGDGVGNSADTRLRRGVTVLGAMRMTQLYKIDPERIFASGNSGGSRIATGTAIMRDDVFTGFIGEVGASATDLLPDDFITSTNPDDLSYEWSASGDSVTSARGASMTFFNGGNQSLEGDFREQEIMTIHHLFMTSNGNLSKLCKGPGEHTTKLDYVFDEAVKYMNHPLYPVIKDDFSNTNLNTNPNPGRGNGFSIISGSPKEGNVANTVSGNSTAATIPAGAEIRSSDVFNWNDSYGMSLTSAFRSSALANANNQMEWRILSADLRETSEIRLTVQQISATSKKASFMLFETGMSPVTVCTFDFDSADEPINRTTTDRAYFNDAGVYQALGYLFRGSDLTWHMDDDKFQFSSRQNITRSTFASPLAIKPTLQNDRWSIQGRWNEIGLGGNINRLKKVKQWRLGFKNSAINTAAAANSAVVDYVNLNVGQQGFMAPQDGSASQGNFYTQASDSTGLLAFEAETFNRQDTRGLHHWIRSTARSGFSGSSAVVSSSDDATTFTEARFAQYSSRLEYDANFTKSGNHKVWIRGHAVSNDSCWIGLNENGLGAVEVDGFTPGSFGWISKTISIANPGPKKISLWIGKDGLAVDQILFASDLNYVPSVAAVPSPVGVVPPLATYTLNTSATNGTVTLYPAGGVYESGQEVTVIAEPAGGYAFNGWTGIPSVTTPITTITMDGNKAITANFSLQSGIYTLTATSLNGSVTFNPPGPNFPVNTVVTVTAVPNDGNVFTGWVGDLSGMTNPTTITMTANKSITANIENPVLPRTNWVASASAGNGSAGSAIDGSITTRWSTGTNQTNGQWFRVDMVSPQIFNRIVLDGGTSANDFPRGYEVHVSNDAVNWGSPVATGVGSSGVNTITFATQTARYIRVTQTGSVTTTTWWSMHEFNVYRPAFLLTETSLNGAVTFNPPGPSYLAGTVVTVTAVPDSNHAFNSWGGGLSGTTNPTTVTMTANTSITANFGSLADPFTTWAGAGVNFGDDANNDGVPEGIAWFLGAGQSNEYATPLLPKPTSVGNALVLEFACLDAVARGTSVFEVQFSNDLGQLDAWAGAAIPGVVGTFTVGVVEFEITDPTPADGLLKVVARIPASEASAGKLFSRLKGVKTF